MNNIQDNKDPFTTFTQQEQEGIIFKAPVTIEFIRLQQAFTQWLRLLNFEPTTQYYSPKKLQEFLSWLESNNITSITNITSTTVAEYYSYLEHRRKQRKDGRLSKNYLRSHVTCLRRFARYLRESGQQSFEVNIHITGSLYNIKNIFTKEEITALYEATGSDTIGIRDKAILAVYYGCGLRRSEAVSLDINDIRFDRNMLFVRKGKNGKERYVPMSPGVQETIREYIDSARIFLVKQPVEALFLNQYGTRIHRQTMADRLQKLKIKAGIEKQAGLHSLRHSIATHLLQSGMELEKIKQFLGHSSLESTQIYTHISNENQ